MAPKQLELPGVDPTGAPPPTLVAGTDLIGEYAGSGYRERSFLARRADGLTLRMTPLLFEVARRVDGRRSYREIVDDVNREHGSDLSAVDVWQLVLRHLQPIGIVAGASTPPPKRADALLGLRWRFNIVPPRAVNAVAALFRPLFAPLAVVAVLAAVGALDAWLLTRHGVAQPAADLLVHPALMALAFALIVVSGGFHEIGHAAACRYGGARPGAVGAGLYVMWPAFFCDVTDAYRLGRAGRLRTDLGGVYFNLIFCLVLATAYALTGHEFLLAIVILQQIEAAHQFFPFLRLDGYYVVADLIGVPDLFLRIRPTLLSFLPGREPDPRAEALRPAARVVVAAWVVLTVGVLGYAYVLLLAGLPRIAGTAARTLVHLGLVEARAIRAHDWLGVAMATGEVLALTLPLVGLAYVLATTVTRLLRALWRGGERPLPRAVLVTVSAVAGLAVGLNLVAYTRPIGPAEAGTIQAARPLPSMVPSSPSPEPTWTPAWTPATARPNPSGMPTSSPAPATAAPTPAPTSTPTAAPSPSPTPVPTPVPTPTPTPTTASPARTATAPAA